MSDDEGDKEYCGALGGCESFCPNQQDQEGWSSGTDGGCRQAILLV